VRSCRSDRPLGAFAAGAAAIAAAALIGGCGNEKSDFRVNELNPLVKRVGEERATLAAVLRASRPGRARDARALREQLGRLGGVLRRIAALKPPDDARARFVSYTRANTEVLASLRRFVEAYAAGSNPRQQAEAQQTQAALAKASRAQTDLQHALQ
jgi:hypothetical protein